MSRASVQVVDGEIRLRQIRHGTEQVVSFAVEDADVMIAWIRSAKAEAERRPIVSDVARLAIPGAPTTSRT